MSALPWGKFFWRDWMTELTLRGCSLAARGLWMDMLCIAAQHEPPGYVAVNGRALDGDSLAKLIGADKGEVNLLLIELDKAGVYSRQENTGMIYSRRMVADHAKHVKAVASGKKGGNPTLGKRSGKDRSVNHLDKAYVIPPFMPTDNQEDNRQVKPQLNGGVKHRDQSTESETRKNKNQNPTSSSVYDAACADDEVRDKARAELEERTTDFCAKVVRAFERSGQTKNPPITSLAHDWKLKPGFDFNQALAVIEAELSRPGCRKDISGLKWFENSVIGKYEATKRGYISGGPAGQVASSQPKLVAREDAVCEGDKPLPDLTSHNMIDLWERGGPWAPVLGMRPDQRGCRVPSDILQARGYRDEHGRMSDRYIELRAQARSKRELVRNSLEPIMKAAPNGGATH